MTEWREALLGDALDVRHGYAFKGECFRDDGELIVLTPGNFHDSGGFKPKSGKEKYYDGPYPPDYLLAKGDVVVAMTEQAHGLLGSTATIPTSGRYLHNQRLGLLRITSPDRLDLRFCYHLLNGPTARHQIQATATGSKVRHTAPERIRAVHVALPDVQTQRTIGRILDAFDDLIENNRRRIELLEQMVEAIYREWFVRFRYPGQEAAVMVDSPLGPIPAGWAVKTIQDLSAVVTRGIAPRYADTGSWTVINQRCIRDSRISLDVARRQERDVPASKQVRFGDILINSTGVGTLGRVGMMLREQRDLTADSHVTIVRPLDPGMQPWFGLHLLLRQSELETMGVGSTGQTELGRQAIGRLPIALPGPTILGGFAEMSWPLVLEVPHLLDQNRNLVAMRDLLLPRLVTGQIDVSKMDLDALVDSVA